MENPEKFTELVKFWTPLISLAGMIFWTGYHFRTLQSMRKHVHEVNNWRQVLPRELDDRYVTRREFVMESENVGKKLDEISASVKETNSLLVNHLINTGKNPSV